MSTATVVFLGPTLPVEQARAVLDATYLPPAAQGDVLRAVRSGARAVGIVDGYFEHVPSIWHKEVLYALQQGVRVYGAASMGALRAVELEAFGMVAVGEVAALYRSGVLEADDEVAVTHAPAESGYAPGSEALVNVRATLDAAAGAGVVAAATAARLLELARALWFPDRSWPRLLSDGRSVLPAATAELQALGRWLPAGRVDRKRLDALALLERLRRDEVLPPHPAPAWRLEHTVWFDHLARHAGPAGDAPGEQVRLELLLDELRLDPDRWWAQLKAALLTVLSLDEADRDGVLPLADAEQRAARVQARVGGRALARLPEQLRRDGTYAALRDRAAAKDRLLAAAGGATLATTGLGEQELVADWATRAGRPGVTSLEDVAAACGFSGADEARRVLVREHLFLRETAAQAAP